MKVFIVRKHIGKLKVRLLFESFESCTEIFVAYKHLYTRLALSNIYIRLNLNVQFIIIELLKVFILLELSLADINSKKLKFNTRMHQLREYFLFKYSSKIHIKR